MKIQNFTILTVIVFLPLLTFSQSVDIRKGFNSLDQAFVYDAIKEDLLLIRQEYILRDVKGATYGRNNKDFYGAIFFIGIAAQNQLWTSDLVNRPWELDKEAVITQGFSPALHKMFIQRELSDKFEQIRRDTMQSPDRVKLKANKLECFIFDKKGLPIRFNQKSREGWVVLAYTDSKSDNSAINIKWAIFKRNLAFIGNDEFALIEHLPDNLNNIIGGAFLETSFTEGQINFTLTGIIQKQVLNWYVYTIPNTPAPECKGWFKCWKEKNKKKKQCRKECLEKK